MTARNLIALFLIAASIPALAAQSANQFRPAPSDDLSAQISEYVRKVFQDRDGNFWFGTNGDGVCRYDGKSLKYFSVEQGLAGQAIRGILQDDDGAMWFATSGGVSRYKDGAFTNYTVGLVENGVWSMMRDRSGVIWVGTEIEVRRFDGTSFVPFDITRAPVGNAGSRSNSILVWSMAQDREGNIWFGTEGEGAFKYDGKTFANYNTKNGLAGDSVRCVYVDRRGHIWLGTEGYGVSRYDGSTITHFTKKDGLSNNRIFEVFETKAGDLWFSTLGDGACRYDGKTFTAYGESDGLTRSHVQDMFEDREGRLWFGCSGGLFRFNGTSFINVTKHGPWPGSEQPSGPPAPAEAAGPMADFARMIGQWRVSFPNGTSASHSWQWGPGKHSMRKMAYMSDGNGNPWAGEVMYWHPGQKQVRVVSLHEDIPAVGRGVAECTIRFEGQTAESFADLYQPRGPRKLLSRLVFDGPDKYRESLLEDSGAGYQPLAEWDFVRGKEHAEPPKRTVANAALELPKHLEAFERLIGKSWEAEGKWTTGSVFHIQSVFEWIPSLEVVFARVASPVQMGEQTHLLDAYLYQHVGTRALRCLALSNRGGVFDGNVTVIEGGALQIDLKGYEGDRMDAYVLRIDFEADGTPRQRLWSVAGSDRLLLLDTPLRKSPATGAP